MSEFLSDSGTHLRDTPRSLPNRQHVRAVRSSLIPVTPKQQLIEMKLGEPLMPFVESRRDDGASWDAIARELWSRTGIAVSDQTIRNYSMRVGA